MKFFMKTYEIKDLQRLNSSNSSYYNELKNFHEKVGKKHTQMKIFIISISSLFILGVLQRQIFLGAMML